MTEPVLVALTLWFEGSTAVPSIQVGGGPRVPLDNRCPGGSSPGVPYAAVPWALGNIASGHRPFVGRILRLEMVYGDRRIDLLREVPWQVPEVFWIWPERLFEPRTFGLTEVVAATWHILSFILLGYLAVASGERRSAVRNFVAVLFFAFVLTSGKIFVSGRHPDMIDLILNAAGTALGIRTGKRYSSADEALPNTRT
jgi:hypothetical protein